MGMLRRDNGWLWRAAIGMAALLLAGCAGSPAQKAATSLTASAKAASTAASGAPVGGQPEHNHVRISYNTTTGAMSFVPIAAKQNLAQKYGITIEPRYIGGSGSTAVAALLSGDTQFQVAGGPAPVQAIASGAPLKILASFEEINGYGIYARPGIKAPADLKGKAVAVAGKGDNTDVSLRAALKKFDMDVDRDGVTEVQVGSDPQRIAALQADKVDAAILDEGAAGPQAEANGAHNILSLRQENIPWVTALVVSDSYANDNPNTVLAALESVIDGVRFLKDPSNRAASIAILAQDMKLSPDDKLPQDAYSAYQQRYGVFDPTAGVTAILDALKTIDPKYVDVTPEKLIDLSYLNKLQAAGFVKVQG